MCAREGSEISYIALQMCAHTLAAAGIVCVLCDDTHIFIMYTYAWYRACILSYHPCLHVLYHPCTVHLYVLKMMLCSITQDDGIAAGFSTQLENGLVIRGFPSFSTAMAQ